MKNMKKTVAIIIIFIFAIEQIAFAAPESALRPPATAVAYDNANESEEAQKFLEHVNKMTDFEQKIRKLFQKPDKANTEQAITLLTQARQS